MIIVDVNALVGGLRSDSVHHDICRSLLEDALAGPRRFGVSPLALSAMVRIVTNPKIFKTADQPTTALSFCTLLLMHPTALQSTPASGIGRSSPISAFERTPEATLCLMLGLLHSQSSTVANG